MRPNRQAVVAAVAVVVLGLAPWRASASEEPAAHTDGFYKKYPQFEEFYPYFAYAGIPGGGRASYQPYEQACELMMDSLNENHFNLVVDYGFFGRIAEMGWGKGWYVQKALRITPRGRTFFAAMRRHRLKIMGHVQIWLGRISPLNPMHKFFEAPDRELTAQEVADAEAKLKEPLEWFAKVSRQLDDIMVAWVTDDEPHHVGPTKAAHALMAKYDPTKPVFNVCPTDGGCRRMVPHVEIQAGDLYLHWDNSRRPWDVQKYFEDYYRLNPKAVTMFVGDLTTWSVHETTKPFLRDGRPDQAELRLLVWQAVAGGAKGIGYWSYSPLWGWTMGGGISKWGPRNCFSTSVIDHYHRPQKMNVLAAVRDMGWRLCAIGPLLLHTRPELKRRPTIGCANLRYSTYVGPMIRCGLLQHNTSDVQFLVVYNCNLDGPASGAVQALPGWKGKGVYDLNRLKEVKPGKNGLPVWLRPGDAAIWLIGSPEEFARCRTVILKNRARMTLPRVEKSLRLARAWKLDTSPVDKLLGQADAEAKAGRFAEHLAARRAALTEADKLIRAHKDLQWCREWMAMVSSRLSAISKKVAGSYRPLDLYQDGRRPVLELAQRNKVARGPLCQLMGLSIRYFEMLGRLRRGPDKKDIRQVRTRIQILYEEANALGAQFDRIITERLAATRKPIRVAYLTAGRETMDFVLTYSWLFDTCHVDWVTLGPDGVLRNRDKKPVKLADYDVLWVYQLNSYRPTRKVKKLKAADVLWTQFLKPEVITAVKAHVASGKGLLLTGLAACYGVPLGYEKTMPDAYHDGGWYQGSFVSGYKPAPGAHGHPAFKDLDVKGFYTNSNASPYNEVSECTWHKRRPSGRTAAALWDSEVGEIADYATLVEYGPSATGGGLVVAMGGTAMDVTPWNSPVKDYPPKRMVRLQRRLLLNVLTYLAKGKAHAFTAPKTSPPKRRITMLPPVWRFKLDPKDEGVAAKWYAPGLDDAKWKSIPIGTSWETCGYEYDGYAWYRVRFRIPGEYKGKRIALHFGAVDELAAVWIDGKAIGKHDEGPGGWNKPFHFDITDRVKDFAGEHQLTVQVHDSTAAGGIWRRVWLEATDK